LFLFRGAGREGGNLVEREAEDLRSPRAFSVVALFELRPPLLLHKIRRLLQPGSAATRLGGAQSAGDLFFLRGLADSLRSD
jgi:hypothetical protein